MNKSSVEDMIKRLEEETIPSLHFAHDTELLMKEINW